MTSVRRQPSGTQAHRFRARRHLVGGVIALAAMLLGLIAIPLLLVVVSPWTWPPNLPAASAVWAALTGPDDGALLLGAVCVVAWLAWLAFAMSVVVELSAVLRHRPTPRIPLLHVPQRGASALVAAIALMSSPASSWSPGSAAIHVQSAPALGSSTQAPGTAAMAVADSGKPRATVGTAQPQVRAVTSHEADGESRRTIVVKRHDTLWDLAEAHLGSGTRYHEIVALNRGRRQADGRMLTDAHWIYPGWTLLLPPKADVALRTSPTMPRSRPHDSPPRRLVAPPPPAAVDRADSTTQVTTGGQQLVDRAPMVSAGQVGGLDADPVPVGAVLDLADDSSARLLAVGSLGALAAAGLLAEIARARRRQQRVRRPGNRISMPGPAAARLERSLRASARPAVAGLVRDSLSALVAGCVRDERELPAVAAARVATDRLTLLLVADDEAVVLPYTLIGPSEWQVAYEDIGPRHVDADEVDPYPALTSVGTQGDELVLVNLEAAGTLRVRAEREQAVPVLSAMTADLVRRSRAGQVTVTLVDAGGSDFVGEGTRVVNDTAAAAVIQRSQVADVSSILLRSGAADLREARSRGVGDETWVPDVAVGQGLSTADPWSGSVTVTFVEHGAISDATTDSGWDLSPVQGELWRLEPGGLTLRAHTLDEGEHNATAELLSPPPPIGDELPQRSWREEAAVVLAALPPMPPGPMIGSDGVAPVVRVLGPVVVDGGDDAAAPGRRRRATEFVAYLVLHPGASRHIVDEVMWPGARVGRNTRNPFVSRVRLWLGRTAAGDPFLPLVPDEGEYRLRAEVCCDWWEFVSLTRRALDGAEPDCAVLVSALELVRGRPFQGVDPSTYSWAEPDVQDMVSAVVDVAHLLSAASLAAGDLRRAAWASARGLAVEPASEVLQCDAIRAARAAGDGPLVRRLVARLRAQLQQIDPDGDLMSETVELLHQVGAHP